MKSILRWSAGLLGLLLLGSVSDGYYWVTPVFKQPYPAAPSPSNSGFYLVDAYGRCTGPHYYLVPPFQPFNGMLPGKTGQAIQQGYLPHTLLMSKEGMALGNVPLLGQKSAQQAQGVANPQAGAGMPQAGMGSGPGPNAGNMQMPYGAMAQSPYPQQSPYAQAMPQPMVNGAGPYPMPYGGMSNSGQSPFMPNAGNMQMPYGAMAQSPYPQQSPYAQAMPQPMVNGAGPYPMPYGNMPRPMPYGGMPNSGQSPFMPIPGFNPSMPGAPMMPGMPGMPAMQGIPGMQGMPSKPGMAPPPGTNMGPGNGSPFFTPMQPFNQFNPLQGPQGPRMDMMPPPPQRGIPYPTHPFTRSPRDFFMWGETMDEERARGSRPFPVP
jgi:hypothetical protein